LAFKSKNLEQTEAQASTNLKTPPNLIDQCQSSSQKPPLNESISIAESKASTIKLQQIFLIFCLINPLINQS